MADRTIKIKFTGDTSGLSTAAAQGQKSMSKFGGSMQKFGAATAAGLAVAGVALFSFVKDSVKAFADAEESQAKLSDAFARFPKLADFSIERLRALNTELARKTKFDDDAFASGQAVLAQFDLTGSQIETLTPLLADYAAKTGQDLPAAAESLGKAFLGNTRALKELGIEYKSTGDLQTDVANITALVREQVGGFAEKQGKTAAGQAAILGNQFGELKETLGGKLLPVLIKVADTGLKVVDWISKNQQIVLPLIAVIAAVTVVQWAWNVAMAANPVGLIIIGVAALIAGIVWLATKTQFFQTVWNTVFSFVTRSLENWKNLFASILGFVSDKWNSIVRGFAGVFATVFNRIADIWNATIGKLSWTIPSWVPIIGGNTIRAPQLPHLAVFHQGGIVPGPFGKEVPILARAGELVLTAEQQRARGMSGGGPDILQLDLDLGHGIHEVVRIDLREHDRGVKRRVLAGSGAR